MSVLASRMPLLLAFTIGAVELAEAASARRTAGTTTWAAKCRTDPSGFTIVDTY